MRLATAFLAASLLIPVSPARAQDDIDVLDKAMADFNGGRSAQAAIGFWKVEETALSPESRHKAEYFLAQSLNKLGLGFSAFFYYGQIIKAGTAHPYYLKAVEGAVAVTEAYNDEVLGPNVLDKAYNDSFARLPPAVLAKINSSIALLSYRAGKYDEAWQFLKGVPAGSSAYPKAQYLAGLLQQRTEPEKAVETFRGILAMTSPDARELSQVQELANLALGRTLYALGRYKEASAHYARLPRFSRHWDEALFEGAYADLQAEDPGGALGKLHSLHSPHLSDQFVPESLDLAGIIYYQHCLYPQVRAALARFDREYVPMRDELKALLDQNPPVAVFWELVANGRADGVKPLPTKVQANLRKNERIDSMLGYLARLDQEARRVREDGALTGSPLGADLLDLIAKQRELVSQLAGKFIKGRLADMVALLDVLDGQKEIIGFEATKGEKEFLEQNVDVKGRLSGQKLLRPAMPATGHEYWPFDGEYWPDEIGYYRYTIKDACPVKTASKEQP